MRSRSPFIFEAASLLLAARPVGDLELARRALLLLEGLASQRLVSALQRELGAVVPALDVGAEVVALLLELLLRGEGGDDLLAGRP